MPTTSSCPETTLVAGCKVNLFLRITARRPDGYHELASLFLPLPEPHDDLILSPGQPGSGLTLTCSVPALAGPSNILHKAWTAHGQATGLAPDLRLHLVKRIPCGAGLGGGSADAAVFLRFLNEAAGPRALPADALLRLAARLGADVPFFLANRPAWAEGVGEVLTPVEPDLSGLTLALVCPPIHVDTAWAYRAWDAAFETAPPGPDSNSQNGSPGLTNSPNRHRGSFCPEAIHLWNSFESVVFPTFPELRRFKERLYALGAAAAVMSGSGSALCALFRDVERATQAALFFQGAGSLAFIHRL